MRLDKALTDRQLVASRSRAQELIRDGLVSVDGAICRKPSQQVTQATVLSVKSGAQDWVSRAAQKLIHGLDHFGLDCKGVTALDIGASTGGFTQVLLARGALQVFAVDVGHGQLHNLLRQDERVVNLEGLNAKNLSSKDFPPIDLIVSDVSFISLTKALPSALDLAQSGARLVALIKPQFEVGREGIGKGGIVRDEAARQTACDTIASFLGERGWQVAGVVQSPVTGSDGNVEYLISATKR